MNPDTKKILFFGGLILFGISVWKILKGKSPKKAVKETIQAPIDITAKVVETVIEPLKKDDPVDKATEHPDVLGAGAKKRKKLKGKKRKVAAVMKEFKKGTLHSGSGKKVKKRSQAIAIAMSESGQSKEYKKEKKEHPTLSKKAVKQIVKDHMKKKHNPKKSEVKYGKGYTTEMGKAHNRPAEMDEDYDMGSAFGIKKRKSKKIADSRTRWHYAQKHFNKGFTQLTLAEAQLVNSDMVAHGYKLSKDEPTKKEIKKELKEMHKSKHKGHKTKRGLSQDQKRKSKESWEKSYRKNKEAAK
jgi:hypothetical protein